MLGALASGAQAVDFSYNGVFTDNGTSGQLNYTGTFNVDELLDRHSGCRALS